MCGMVTDTPNADDDLLSERYPQQDLFVSDVADTDQVLFVNRDTMPKDQEEADQTSQ